jgi:hypothetical protein
VAEFFFAILGRDSMNLKRLPVYLLVLLLVSSLAACVMPFTRSTPAAKPTLDSGVVRTLTAIAAKNKATNQAQPTAPAESTATVEPTAIPPTAISLPPTWTPTTEPGAPAGVTEAAPAAVPSTGMRLVYTDAGRNLWIWFEGGITRQLVKTGDVNEGRISTDGSQIAYIRTQNFKKFSVWEINADGSNDHQVLSEDDLDVMKNNKDAIGAQPYVIDWIPGKHSLAFVTSPIFDGPGLQVNDDLWELNTDTGSLSLLLEPGQGGIFYYSPDGKQIALVTPKTISLIDADGGNRRDSVLKFTPVKTFSEFLYYPTPKWAPDSNLLFVAIPPKDALATPRQKTTLYAISTDGSPAVKIGSVTTAPLLAPEFSPDTTRMIYVKEHGDASDNQRELHIADANGSGDTVYLTAEVDFGGWAPDSSRFVFTEVEDTHLGQIGEDPAWLSSDTRTATAVSWLSNGKILFLHRITRGWEIKLGTPGGTSEVLVSLPGDPANFMPTYAVKE